MDAVRMKLEQHRRKALAVLLAALLALVYVGAQGTGAFFSDSHDGAITGTLGSIRVTPSGGSGADRTNFAFNNLLPGEPQTAMLKYTNSGNSLEDVWVVFPNATALSALNNLGTYGEVHVRSNGKAVFDSANLNDHANTCGPFTQDQTSQGPGCWPLPRAIKLASKVAPGYGGVMTFSFNYASKLQAQPAAGQTASFNVWPVSDQYTTNAADGSGDGLPYQLVAVQHGQQP